MSVLSDIEIRREILMGALVIRPITQQSIQPASVDVRLANSLIVYDSDDIPEDYVVDLHQPDEYGRIVNLEPRIPFYVKPGQFVLAATYETLVIPNDIVARLEGKSSLARRGLVIHSTAGFIDPGFQGTVTLEISNSFPRPVPLEAWMKIGQISFQRTGQPASIPYGDERLGSKYQYQTLPTRSRYHLNYRS